MCWSFSVCLCRPILCLCPALCLQRELPPLGFQLDLTSRRWMVREVRVFILALHPHLRLTFDPSRSLDISRPQFSYVCMAGGVNQITSEVVFTCCPIFLLLGSSESIVHICQVKEVWIPNWSFLKVVRMLPFRKGSKWQDKEIPDLSWSLFTLFTVDWFLFII